MITILLACCLATVVVYGAILVFLYWRCPRAPREPEGLRGPWMPHADGLLVRKTDDEFGTVTGVPRTIYFEVRDRR